MKTVDLNDDDTDADNGDEYADDEADDDEYVDLTIHVRN